MRSVASHPRFKPWLRLRAGVVLPLVLVWAGVGAMSDLSRRRLLGSSLVLLLMAVPAERLIDWKHALRARGAWAGILAGLMVVGAAVTLTGGLSSPCLALMVLPLASAGFLFGARRETVWSVMLGGALLALIGLLPRSLTGPPISEPHRALLTALAVIFLLIALPMVISFLSEVLKSSSLELNRLRGELLAQAVERTRSLESVSSKVAHELKNPLAAMKALAQLVHRGELEARTRERLEVMQGEIIRMESIMQEYMSFTRPMQDLALEEVELNVLAEEVLALLSARAEEAQVELSLKQVPVQVRADPRRLKEALLNLAANAVEATPAGGKVQLEVREARIEARGVELIIRDGGRGLTREALAKIGTPFFTTRPTGTGLGVVIAKTVVAQHGGAVDFASELGQGTTVTVRIPRTPPSAAAP